LDRFNCDGNPIISNTKDSLGISEVTIEDSNQDSYGHPPIFRTHSADAPVANTKHTSGNKKDGLRKRGQLTGHFDTALLWAVVVTVLFSLLMVYSTSGVKSLNEYGSEWFFVKKQAGAAVVGLVALFVFSKFPLRWLKEYSAWFLIPGLLVLFLPLIPGIGRTVNGASRWAQLGPLGFQPSEITKICFVVFLSGFLSRHEVRLSRFSFGVIRPFGFVGLAAGLLLLQPDFGTCVILALVTLCMTLVAGVPLVHFGWCLLGVALSAAALIVQSPYRLARVLNFTDPFKDRLGKGYQLAQSLIAVGTGRLEGKGFGNSSQKLHFLPDAHTDFIFAVIAEELGLAGCVTLIALFLLILWRGTRIARRYVSDTFSFCLITGLTLMLVLPAAINMGVVLGMLPTKGLPLPLVSFGGSSLVLSLATVGILLAYSRGEKRPSGKQSYDPLGEFDVGPYGFVR
jgi:cell division protein FtsW